MFRVPRHVSTLQQWRSPIIRVVGIVAISMVSVFRREIAFMSCRHDRHRHALHLRLPDLFTCILATMCSFGHAKVEEECEEVECIAECNDPFEYG